MRRKKYKKIVINPTKKKLSFYQFFMIGMSLLLLIGGGSYAMLRGAIFSNQAQGNAGILDTKAPVIKLSGDKNMIISMGSVFVDPGVSYVLSDDASVNIGDVEISYQYMKDTKVVDISQIDTTKPGINFIYYQVRDKKGNLGIAVRRVEVLGATNTVHS